MAISCDAPTRVIRDWSANRPVGREFQQIAGERIIEQADVEGNSWN